MIETEHYQIAIINSGEHIFLDMLDKRTGEVHCFYKCKKIKSHWIYFRSYQEHSVYSIERKYDIKTRATYKKCFDNPFEQYSEYIILMKKEVVDLVKYWFDSIEQTITRVIANYIKPILVKKVN